MRKTRALRSLSLLAGLMVGAAVSAQTAYVVNSDDVSVRDFDALHTVSLPTGQATKVGEVRVTADSAPFADIEGLAFSPDGTLYGIDDATKTLVRIETSTGRAQPVNGSEGNTGLPRNINFDFGLSFDCNGELFASSDSRRSLYRLNLSTGAATIVGAEGALGAPITALAAKGPQMFGIGSEGSENLYKVDTVTGRSTLVGPLGANNLRFSDGGLDFDATGRLWAIADMSGGSLNPEPSVLVRIDETTGAAERIGITVSGAESLAIAAPICAAPEGTDAIPAIPVLDRSGLTLLALLLALAGMLALRMRQPG